MIKQLISYFYFVFVSKKCQLKHIVKSYHITICCWNFSWRKVRKNSGMDIVTVVHFDLLFKKKTKEKLTT